MIRRVKAITAIGIIESFKAPLREHGFVGLLMHWLLSCATTVLPFVLLLLQVVKGYGIGWYIHFAVFFEIITLLIANDREITDYRSMSQFPLTAGQTLFLRTVRRFINPVSFLATGLYAAAIVIRYRSFAARPLSVAGIVITAISFIIIFEDVQLWKEKAGKGNIINAVLILLALAAGIVPVFTNPHYSAVYLAFSGMWSHWYICFATLALSIAAYVVIVKIPQRFLDRFHRDKENVSTSNLIVKAVNALPGNKPLKQLFMKDYRVMLHSNVGIIINVVLWVFISWLVTKYQDISAVPFLKNEFVALCYSGVVIQLLSAVLSRPFAGDSYSAWVTLLSPVPRKYILISKDLVILASSVIFFIPMSVYLIATGRIGFKGAGLWFLMYLCYAFIMMMILNRSLVTTQMKAVKNGKRKAIVSAVISFAGRLAGYVVAVLSAVLFQILLDSRYALLSPVITVPLLIILIFVWYMGLDGQIKYINKYTQSITQSLVIS